MNVSRAEYVRREPGSEVGVSELKPLEPPEPEVQVRDVVLRALVERHKEVSRNESVENASKGFVAYLCLHEHGKTTDSEPRTP